jgi:hypothetical protein
MASLQWAKPDSTANALRGSFGSFRYAKEQGG